MGISTAPGAMTGDEIVALTKRHTIFEWSAQAKVDPIPVAGAKGCWFWTPEGKRYLDFNSQLMCTNIGHGDRARRRGHPEQAATLAYANPFMATEPRARLGAKLAELTPGDIDTFFFTNGGAEANENAIKVARMFTGRHKILARYRAYHGGTAGAITLTGDPRRWAAEPGIPGVVRIPDFHRWGQQATRSRSARSCSDLEDVDHATRARRPSPRSSSRPSSARTASSSRPTATCRVCARSATGTASCSIADEVMAGFGRTGQWFAIDHWGVVPDLITMAKGLTSAYVQLGAVGDAPRHRRRTSGTTSSTAA